MSYKKFKGKDIENLGYQTRPETLFLTEVAAVLPSSYLLQAIENAKIIRPASEKSISEFRIAPIFGEIKLRNKDKISLFSGEVLNGDVSKGLNGEVDFVISKYTAMNEIIAPVFCTYEAKVGKIDKHYSQAMAQMIGAYEFNVKENAKINVIYGCITDGYNWQFMKLEDKIIYIDSEIISFKELPIILGRLQWIVDFYTK